jgi:antitoxin MazE
MYIMEMVMQVSKWGNSLAIRLPKGLVEELGLKEGDEVTLAKAKDGQFDVAKRDRDAARTQAILRMRERGWHAPADYKFDRDEANAR